MLTRVRPFRHAASIIIAANNRSGSKTKETDGSLAILTAKRKPSSSFMPSTVVFPGGALDEADFADDFVRGYKQAFNAERKLPSTINDDEWIKHVRRSDSSSTPRPPAYDALGESKHSTTVPPEWALRICALRELFEECGILIGYCLNRNRYVIWDERENGSEDLSAWSTARRRVRESSSQFHEFTVRESGVVPAFWLLDEWSNWLAPSTYKQRSRFDTLFYLICLDRTPTAVVNEDELDAAEWSSPREVLSDGAAGRVMLAPPQIYEMSRLANFSSSEQLRRFSDERKTKGMVRFFPRLIKTSDGKTVTLLPGDDQYPVDMREDDCDQPFAKFAETAAQLRSKYKNLHRGEFQFRDGHYQDAKLFINVPPPCGHVSPISS